MNYSEAFRGISTCDLSDAGDTLGIVPATRGQVKGMYPGCARICGPIVTCRMSPSGPKEVVIGTIEPLLTAAPGSIFLIDAGGNLTHNTIGSLGTVVAVHRRRMRARRGGDCRARLSDLRAGHRRAVGPIAGGDRVDRRAGDLLRHRSPSRGHRGRRPQRRHRLPGSPRGRSPPGCNRLAMPSSVCRIRSAVLTDVCRRAVSRRASSSRCRACASR